MKPWRRRRKRLRRRERQQRGRVFAEALADVLYRSLKAEYDAKAERAARGWRALR